MWQDGFWIYWPEQCKYCNSQACNYIMKNNVQEYISNLLKIEKKTEFVYGSLYWSCDYFNFDKDKYLRDAIGECCND